MFFREKKTSHFNIIVGHSSSPTNGAAEGWKLWFLSLVSRLFDFLFMMLLLTKMTNKLFTKVDLRMFLWQHNSLIEYD